MINLSSRQSSWPNGLLRLWGSQLALPLPAGRLALIWQANHLDQSLREMLSGHPFLIEEMRKESFFGKVARSPGEEEAFL